MKSHVKKGGAKRARPAAARSLPEALRPWLLAGLMALCVARPLLPSEGISWLGDGQPFIMLALILTAGYLLAVAIHGQFTQRFNLLDAFVAALIGLCIISALMGASSGNPRMSLNMLWEWAGLGLVYFLARQLVRTAQEARGLVAVMFALAVVLSAFGYYQVFVGLPADRAAYAANPDEVLRSVGHWYPAGSPERQLFENRLQSTEPLATFALTNSLAGFLAPWLVVALGIGGSMLAAQRSATEPQPRSAMGMARIVAFALSVLAVAGCFVLTKSRSGYVALAVGIALVPVALGAGRRMLNWRFALFAVGTLLMLVGGAVAIKGLDAKVLTEAFKSLEYRLEYWQATLGMIGDYPLLGVGPGNFQDFYTQYKLPQASEEIRDPHNFLLEVWATSGTFALVALCLVLIAFARSAWRLPTSTQATDADEREPGARSGNVKFMAVGGVVGLVLAFLIGPLFGHVLSEGQFAGALLLGGGVVAILWPWIIAGTLPPRVPGLGVLVLSIHWLAAGGIAFPGVAGTFWLLLALGVRRAEETTGEHPAGASKLVLRMIPIAALGLVSAAGAACYYSAYGPVLHFHAAMSQAYEVRHPAARLIAFMDAADADPLAPEPWLAMAELELEQLKKNPTSEAVHRRFVDATTRAMELQPQSSATWRQIGQWYIELYAANHDPRAADTGLECLRGAVRMYPRSATLRGEFALALELTGRADAARHHAQEALELSRQTPHADKKLPAELESRLETLVAEPR